MTTEIINQSGGTSVIATMVENCFVVSKNETTVVVSQVGAQGAPGTGVEVLGPLLVGVAWGTPSAESGNAIEVAASVSEVNGEALSTSLLDVEVLVTDGATDCKPSATATLSAASTPVGTVLGGSGTARLTIRSASGAFKVKVTETAAAHRYLWLKGSGHCRLWPRSLSGVLELAFA